MSNEVGTATKKAMPPYIAFQSLRTLAANFKEHALPDRIDRSVLTNFSGAVGGQIITALRFLGLIDASGAPTTQMRELVEAYGSDAWTETLGKVLRAAYAPIFKLNLQTCTPAQFMERFKETYDGAEDVLRKSITFFLNAVRDADIPVSSFIMKARKPRTAASKKRQPRKEAQPQKDDDDEEEDEVETPSADLLAPQFMKELLEKFPTFDPGWPEQVQAKWFDAFTQLMARVDQKPENK